MTPLEITVALPDKRLQPNSDASKRTRERLRARQREYAGLAAREVVGAVDAPHFPAGVRVVATALVRWDRPGRFPDVDNTVASLKGAADGLADGLALADDRQIVRWEVMFERVGLRRGEVVLTLAEEPDSAEAMRLRIDLALSLLGEHGVAEGAHHQRWVIDQVARMLTTPEEYAALFGGRDDWDGGSAP